MGRLPIRWRLTIWYTAFLAVVLALSGLGLYVGLRQILYGNFHEQVQSTFALARSAVRTDGDRVSLDPGTAESLRTDERFVRLFDLDGTAVVDTSASAGTIPIDPALIAGALAGQTRTTHAPGNDGTMEIVTAPVQTTGVIAGALQVGVSRGDTDEVLRALLLVLGIVAPLSLATAAGVGYVLAGRALAPVAAITETAAGIGAN
ncbi:MAG TPA: hypothetical protein VKB09_13480, partial [Thermomicrobiales bacterium]|nr:hypothetical protein [Thermomicrobiales bacterium]